ncbi:hypothetical protein PVK06_043697 [Gossypium arboreum]|uniref:Uncharacterized protein n=1 Tax=Gossypium arboreum TaxID=29729 RepID=A0ABR0MPM3_GOSAR|nr:hypothetical protein PVK06_043697 [Gossypium arboreum]
MERSRSNFGESYLHVSPMEQISATSLIFTKQEWSRQNILDLIFAEQERSRSNFGESYLHVSAMEQISATSLIFTE